MRHLIGLITLFVIATTSTFAFAQDSAKLIRNVPVESQLVLGLEVPKLQKSFLYGEVMKVLKDQSSSSSVLGFVLSSKAFDLDRDVRSMLVALEKAPSNPQNPQQAASLVIVEGKLDRAKVKKAAVEKFGKLNTRKLGELEVWSFAGLSLAFVNDETLILADDGEYAKKAWKAVADEKKAASSNATLTQLMSLTNTNQGLWLTIVTKGQSAAPGSPPMDGAAMSIDVRKGVAADFRTQFENPDDAKTALKQFMEMKETSGQDPMIKMLGAQALVDNLTAKVVDERVLAMKTSLTNAEVQQLLLRLKAMNESPPPMAPSGTKTGTESTEDSKTAPPKPTSGQGIDADFN